MSHPVTFSLMLLMLSACASDFTTSSSSPGKPPEVVVVEPTPEEIRAAQLRKQGEEIAELRDLLEANRARSDAAAARMNAATVQSQSEMRALESELTEVRIRAESASEQSDKAFAIATEFLSNLVAAREEQRAIVERNISVFDRMELRLASIEGRIAETRNMSQAELAATRTRSSDMEQRLKEADQELLDLREQLLELHRNNEETRAAVDSGPMLDMLRQLEGTQRDTSGLRGALEEMQREQESARSRMQNYYLDLDARIQDLQERERAAREAEAKLYEESDASAPAGTLLDEVSDMPEVQALEADTFGSGNGEGVGRTPESGRPVGTLPAAEPMEILPLIEAVPLIEEVTPPSDGAELDETKSEVPDSTDEAIDLDTGEIEASVAEESGFEVESAEEGNDGFESETGNDIDLDAREDAPPGIVDTVDAIPAEPYLQDEMIPGGTEAGPNSLEESEMVPTEQASPIDQDIDSSTNELGEGHGVMTTDWTSEDDSGETESAPE